MAIQAKFRVHTKTEHMYDRPALASGTVIRTDHVIGQVDVVLKPVPANEAGAPAENRIFGEATPGGELRLVLMGKGVKAADEFVVGADYNITIQKARK